MYGHKYTEYDIAQAEYETFKNVIKVLFIKGGYVFPSDPKLALEELYKEFTWTYNWRINGFIRDYLKENHN